METDQYAQGMSQFEEKNFDDMSRLTEFEFSLFKGYLGSKVLEVGAGWGRVTEHVLENHSFKEYVAIEPSSDLFAKLTHRLGKHKELQLIQGEVGSLKPNYIEHFDSSFSVHVLEHVEDDRKFIEDSLELLKKDGRLVILVPALQFLFSNLDRNIGHYRRYDKKMIERLIDGLNVEVERLFYSNFLGVLASLYFIKIRKLEYQSSNKKNKFVALLKIYNNVFIPMIAFVERIFPVPVGLNLTVVLKKK